MIPLFVLFNGKEWTLVSLYVSFTHMHMTTVSECAASQVESNQKKKRNMWGVRSQ